jgi:hypothetical protein
VCSARAGRSPARARRLLRRSARESVKRHCPQNNAASTRRALACTPRCAAPPISARSWSSCAAYITRPAIANERLTRNRAGDVVLQLKGPYHDGTTHIVMSPLELMQRLAALVPRPRLHLIRFYMDASRLPRTSLVWWTGIGCSFISGLWCRRDSLLALMESADPRLISWKDSKSGSGYRLGGSRSDLFAITR